MTTTTKNQKEDKVLSVPITTVVSPFRVLFLGITLLMIGTTGFYYIPGMISNDANGSKLVNSFYCASITLMTIGYGDICPGKFVPYYGKIFLITFVICGLGVFCGPFMDLMSSWKYQVPGGPGTTALIASIVLGLGVVIFSTIEGVNDHTDALYASIITATTIGYGDFTPQTDTGKIAVAIFGMISVNALSIILQPARNVLENLCRVKSLSTTTTAATTTTTSSTKATKTD